MESLIIYVIVSGLLGFLLMSIIREENRIETEITNTNSKQDQIDAHQSIIGYNNVDLSRIQSLKLEFGKLGFLEFNQHYIQYNTNVEQPINNRYSQYNCDFGDQKQGDVDDLERRIAVTVQLNNSLLEFNQIYNLEVNTADNSIIEIHFDDEWSEPSVDFENAYLVYKQKIQNLLNKGCQKYFGLADVRFHKDEYKKILDLEYGYCLSPDLITLDEFKSVLNASDCSGLDAYFYVDDVVLSISYKEDYSASINIIKADLFETTVSYFGRDDRDLDALSIEEKEIKYRNFIAKSLEHREKEESQAELDGYKIDKTYQDPFLNKVIIE